MKMVHQKTKTLVTKDNGRSSDAVSPNFIYGCLGGCMSSYCYVGRYNNNTVYINDNTQDVLKSVFEWVKKQPWPKVPNQTDPTFYTIDIGVSTDIPLHLKHYDWQAVFDFFNQYIKAKSTFATKYPSTMVKKLNDYNLEPLKHRIRVSLMPQVYSDILEPNTESIASRISTIPALQEKFEVHINFSPIIYTEGWIDEYRKLFQELKNQGINLPCECIFLTYSERSYANATGEMNNLLWKPELQEKKNSTYAPDNIRYKWQLKNQMVSEFRQLYSEFFEPTNIRYIF